ncbi:MAG: 16S rRNA (cytosine(1402)-N(4))-methyltransferase RsmH [Candidatus Brocadiia bacterium]
MHTPVLVREVTDLLRPAPGDRAIDATVGLGGHAEQLLSRILPGGVLLGVDRDGQALARAAERLASYGGHFELVQGDFRRLAALAREAGLGAGDCVLFDLGLSGLQLESAARGFSFSAEGPLDMRMDQQQQTTAQSLLRRSSARELEAIFRDYGEERYARRIARAIAQRRGELRTTGDLARLVERVVPRRERRIHPATRVFQALRIAVNDELGALRQTLDQLPQWLARGGRVAVISFHSLEDRIVKHALRAYAGSGEVELLTRKPVRPSQEEVEANPQARSARLRAAVRRAG